MMATEEKDVIIGNRRVAPGVLPKLLLFSLAMILVPIGAYFVAYSIFRDVLNVGGSSATYSAIVAVLAVHAIIVLYVVEAFREDSGPSKNDSKRD
jgi:hypothetical protein